MTWGHPELLALLLLGPIVLVGAVVAWRARARALARLASVPALAALIPAGASRARAWQAVLAVIAVVAAAIAAAGPQLGFDWEQRRMEGVSIVVALDVSRSMDAQDVSPSRLERARREIEDLTRLLRGDAVGLVLFAEGAWVRIPLTTDYGTFLWAVKDSTSATIQAQGTALSGAIDAGTKMLSRAPGTGKALIVVSDGEDHEKDEAIDAAVARANEAGVHLFVLGVGDTSGAPIPLAEGGFKKDRSGNVVLSKLDEDRLKALAQATGGAYVRSVVSDDDVRGIYEGEIRGKMEAAERGVRRDKRPRERYQWPLGVAAAAMVLSAGLGIGPRRARAALLLLGLALAAPSSAQAGVREDGMSAYKAEKWEDAVRELGQARVADPSDREVGQALATSLYRAGRYREAEQLFETLASSATDARERAIHQFNAGNAAYRGGRLQEALQDFEAAKKDAPDLQAAAKNSEAVSREIQARLQTPPPQPPQGQDGQADQSQSQDGQQGQDGAQQQGDQQQAGQQGDQQQAGQQGNQQQAGQQGDQQQAGQQGDQQQAGQGGQAPPPDGTRDPSQAAAGQPEGEPGEDQQPGASMAQGEPADNGSSDMTADQAARLVDAVPDGKPQVEIAGQTSGEDW